MSRSSPVRTAAITNLGCKVNQSEMDAVQRLLRSRGVRLVDDRDRADLYVVNTCTVTTVADQKSRQAVRRARRANPGAEVVVTGCSVQVDAAALAAADPSAHLVPNDAKDRLLAELEALLDLPEGAELPTLSGVERAVPAGSASPVAVALDGIADGRTAIDRTRAFVKVQDGCSFHCTYCIIPRARGAERSLPPDEVLADVRRALADGHREIVLTGINIGTYDGGASLPGPRGSHAWAALDLPGLVRQILDETDVERIRLSSIEPQHVDDALLDAWTDPRHAGRCLPHFHLPLQSGDDGVLRRMGRRYDAASYSALVARIRAAIPGVAIHADLITGFPTEDDAAWRRTVEFLERLEPAGLHVFRYSRRPGTPATRMTGQVDEATRRRRSAEALELAAAARARFARRQLGRRRAVLFEEQLPDGRWVGHAENHVLVASTATDGRSLANAIGIVRATAIDRAEPGRLDGRVERLSPPPWPRDAVGEAVPPGAPFTVGVHLRPARDVPSAPRTDGPAPAPGVRATGREPLARHRRLEEAPHAV